MTPANHRDKHVDVHNGTVSLESMSVGGRGGGGGGEGGREEKKSRKRGDPCAFLFFLENIWFIMWYFITGL